MINYAFISDALLRYEKFGYTRIESPWLVSRPVSDVTRPEGAPEYLVSKGDKTKVFVASGEQSLLYLIVKGYLPGGKYVTVTPCLRDDTWSDTHSKQFMKIELIDYLASKPTTVDEVNDRVNTVMNEAFSTMYDMIPASASLTRKGTMPEDSKILSYDIEANGIEVGSYGYRRHEHIHWVYGTGLAEPRFSNAIRIF